MSEGVLVYSLAFLTLMPDYLCEDLDGVYHCDRLDTCPRVIGRLPLDQPNFSVNWENSTSLHNMVDVLDLRCAESWRIGLLGSSFFVGAVLGNLFISGLGDSMGRIAVMRIGLVITAATYFLFMFVSRSLILDYILLTLFGSMQCWRENVAFLYSQEITAAKYQTIVGSGFNVFDSSTLIVVALYYWYVSKSYEWIHLFYFGLIGSSLVIVMLLPESPKFLVSMKRYSEARKVFD